MKKKIYLGGVTLATMMFFASCSSCTKNETEQKVIKTDSLPRNPTQGQVYHDNNGHSWVYDAILMRWALGGGSMGGGTNNYYYYPSTGSYQDNTGRTVTPPSTVSSGISDGVKARTETVTKTVTVPKSTTSTSSKSSTTTVSKTSKPSSSSKAVFGSTSRSHSISA